MNEQQPIPMLQAEPPSDEHKRLVSLFSDMESKQLEFLDGAGKSIIERIATLLAVVFAVMAFGGNFPPKYLVGHFWTKVMVFVVLACYLLSMVLGMLAMNGLPRPYHPLFHVPRFALASRDQFFLCIEAGDPRFDREATRNFLAGFTQLPVVEVPH